MSREADLQDDVIKLLEKKKVWHFRYTASTTFGLPDILALLNGFFIGIELKREDGKGKATILQMEIVESIRDNGGLAAVIDNKYDVEGLIDTIRSGGIIDDKWLN